MLTLDANGLCLAQTLDCGQCFRWQPQPDGSWVGVVEGRAVQAWQEDGRLCLGSLIPRCSYCTGSDRRAAASCLTENKKYEWKEERNR